MNPGEEQLFNESLQLIVLRITLIHRALFCIGPRYKLFNRSYFNHFYLKVEYNLGKLKKHLPFAPAILLLGVCPKSHTHAQGHV